jgi:hypothetical protein
VFDPAEIRIAHGLCQRTRMATTVTRLPSSRSGDTLLFDGLSHIGERYAPEVALISVATNPPGRRLYMDPDEAIHAARSL